MYPDPKTMPRPADALKEAVRQHTAAKLREVKDAGEYEAFIFPEKVDTGVDINFLLEFLDVDLPEGYQVERSCYYPPNDECNFPFNERYCVHITWRQRRNEHA